MNPGGCQYFFIIKTDISGFCNRRALRQRTAQAVVGLLASGRIIQWLSPNFGVFSHGCPKYPTSATIQKTKPVTNKIVMAGIS